MHTQHRFLNINNNSNANINSNSSTKHWSIELIDGQLRIKLRLYNYFNVLPFLFSTKICFYLKELAQTTATNNKTIKVPNHSKWTLIPVFLVIWFIYFHTVSIWRWWDSDHHSPMEMFIKKAPSITISWSHRCVTHFDSWRRKFDWLK